MFELRWNMHTHTHRAHSHTQTIPYLSSNIKTPVPNVDPNVELRCAYTHRLFLDLSSNIKTPVWNVWGEMEHTRTHKHPNSTVPHTVPTPKPQHTQTLPTLLSSLTVSLSPPPPPKPLLSRCAATAVCHHTSPFIMYHILHPYHSESPSVDTPKRFGWLSSNLLVAPSSGNTTGLF